MILKSYLLENNPENLNQYNSILFYGENDGLKDDFKDKINILNKTAEIITFYQEDILKDVNILTKNIINESLFNTKKIIIINEADNKILVYLEEVLEKVNENIKIFIF